MKPVDPLLAALESFPRRAYLVAVSGGRDSVALLHALHALGHKKLTVVHLDHRLRGRASAADAAFVACLAKKLGHPALLGRADARAYAAGRGLSIEHAARELRHVFFEACARRTRCRRVILAHHANDQIETCLHNFLRGTGVAGLAGMRPATSVGALTFVRPLLGIRRAEIDAYIAAHGLKFREDATNAGRDATRNRLRLDVIPAITRAVGPSFGDAILRAAEILREEDAWMESLVAPPPATLRVADLRALPLAARRRTVRRWLRERGVAEAGFAETERVLSLLDGPAKINLPGDRHARRRAGEIFLEP